MVLKVIAVLSFIVASAVLYVYIQNVAEPASSPTMQGTVTGVDTERMEILTANDSAPKTVLISPTTKIEKILLQKNASSTVETEIPVEVNIGDVQKGTLVTVSYQSEKDSVLSGVSRVAFTSEESVEEHMKQSLELVKANPNGYVRGKVVAIDLVKRELAYRAYSFLTLNTKVDYVTFPDSIPVYKVDSYLRLAVVHARETIALIDIKPGQTIIITVERKSLEKQVVTPLEFTVSEQ